MESVDIAEMLSLKAGRHLQTAYQLHRKAVSALDQVERNMFFIQEAESCIEAVILFQASIEAAINEEIERNRQLANVKKEKDARQRRFRNLSFKSRFWKSFDELGLDPNYGPLADYIEFYNSFRVPITHPSSRFVEIRKYTFRSVYDGIRAGWQALRLLYDKLQSPNNHLTWEEFCQRSGLPV